MDVEKFKKISLRGRVAYAICCFENVLKELAWKNDGWEIVLNFLWKFTSSEDLEYCNTIANEIIPENLLEFSDYNKHDFEFLSKDDFVALYELYINIDQRFNVLLFNIHELGASHAYGSIEGFGESSLKVLNEIIIITKELNVELPKIEIFLKFSIEENKAWGNLFDGKTLSKF